MAGKHIRVTSFSQPPEHTGGTLDIGEEESKGLHKQSVRSPPSRLLADIGLRVNEVKHVYLADVNWDLGQFGTLHVRLGKGARGSGPRERMVPLINCAGRPCGHQRPGHAHPSQVVGAVPRNSTVRQNLPLLVFPVVVGGQLL